MIGSQLYCSLALERANRDPGSAAKANVERAGPDELDPQGAACGLAACHLHFSSLYQRDEFRFSFSPSRSCRSGRRP